MPLLNSGWGEQIQQIHVALLKRTSMMMWSQHFPSFDSTRWFECPKLETLVDFGRIWGERSFFFVWKGLKKARSYNFLVAFFSLVLGRFVQDYKIYPVICPVIDAQCHRTSSLKLSGPTWDTCSLLLRFLHVMRTSWSQSGDEYFSK